MDLEQCFVAEIPKSYNEILIIKGYEGNKNYMYSNLGESSLDSLNSQTNYKDFYADHHTSSIYYKSENILKKCESNFKSDQVCELMICLEGDIGSKYSIAFTYNSKPFTLVKYISIFGPTILSLQKTINFYYSFDKTEDFVDIEMYSELGFMKMES